MKSFIFIFSLFFISGLFQSCAPTLPNIEQIGKRRFQNKISSLITTSDIRAQIGIEIRSLRTNKTYYGLNKDQLLTPASNMKILTSASALHFLGPHFQFQTSISQNGQNLWLVGGGDPDLSLKDLDSLADLVSQKMVTVDTLFLDASKFDDFQYGKGWMWDEGSWEYSAPIGALNANQNCVEFIYQPGKTGEPVRIQTSPQTDYIHIKNESITVNDTIDFEPFSIERDWVNQTNSFLISGELLQYTSKDTVTRNITNPTQFTGTIFKEMLESKGVKVHQLFTGKHPSLTPTFTHDSDSLFRLIQDTMHDSDNLTAEILVKTMGAAESRSAAWGMGIDSMKSLLATHVNIDTSALKIADGSGLSRYNLLSPSQIVDVLAGMFYHEQGECFIKSFPVGGAKESTLEYRLKNTNGNILAKTGSISGVSTLSGYAFSPKYGPLAFSIMMNGFVGSSYPYRKLQDQICQWLVN